MNHKAKNESPPKNEICKTCFISLIVIVLLPEKNILNAIFIHSLTTVFI